MPLSPTALLDGFMNLDSPSPPSSSTEAAGRWADAWWGFFSQMTYVNPASAQALAKSAFLGVMSTAMEPTESASAFWGAFSGAVSAACGAMTPLTLNGAMSLVPPSAPLYPAISSLLEANIKEQSTMSARSALATAIYTWHLSGMAVLPTPPGGTTPFV